ncbi:DNA gyrase subunit B, partial [Pyxidicoccus fallax]
NGPGVPRDFVDAVRKRPGMYVGDVGVYGLHHLVYFLLDAVFLDERRGECGGFELEVDAEGGLSLVAGGNVVPPEGMLEEAEGALFFRQPKTHGWAWANSLPVSLALSSRYQLDVWDQGRQWRLMGEQGRPRGGVSEVTPVEPVSVQGPRVLRVRLVPDATVLEVTTFDSERLSRRCRELTYLAPGLRARFIDHRTGEDSRLYYPGGITERLREMTADVPRRHAEPLSFDVSWETLRVRCALQWCEEGEGVWSYANTVWTRKQGVHVDGVFLALRGALAQLTGERVQDFLRSRLSRGLWALVAVDGPDERMAFKGPTKDLLAIEGLREAVQARLQPLLVEALREHPLRSWLVEQGLVL